MLPSLVVVSTGVVVLVVLLLVCRRAIVRFTRARDALQEQVAQRTAELQALRAARRPGTR